MMFVINMISATLGTASALITISDKISGWIDENKYDNDTESIHMELVREFDDVQSRSIERLNEQFHKNLTEKDNDLKLFEELCQEYRTAPINRYFDSRDFCSAIQAVETSQERYKDNERAMRLARMYTSVFFEEMEHPKYSLLGRWYDHITTSGISTKCDKIKELLISCDKDISSILASSDIICTKVDEVKLAVTKSEKIVQGIRRTIDSALLYVALSIISSGIIFMVGIIMNIELEPLYMFGIPLCMLLSDVFVCSINRTRSNYLNSIQNPTKFSNFRKGLFFYANVSFSVLLQTTISLTLIFFISKVFSVTQKNNYAYWMWFIALLTASTVVQLVRFGFAQISVKKNKTSLDWNYH